MATDVLAQDTSAAGYPAAWEFDGLLTDGTAVRVRPANPDDVSLLGTFHAALSQESMYRRYFGIHAALTHDELVDIATVDYRNRMAFVAINGDALIGYASFDRFVSKPDDAEIAFLVADEARHRGVATLLFESLAAYARSLGISRFIAEVLEGNNEMLQVFGATGLALERSGSDGNVEITIDLQPTRAYVACCDEREAVAEAASVTSILRPRSIAVVGAGREPGGAGHEIVHSLMASDFTGMVYPVNPHAQAISGASAFPSLSSLPRPIDLVIVAVQPKVVGEIVDESAAIGARAIVIITAGFGETGKKGAAVETQILSVARHHGMRIVGPNCLGVVNTDPTVRMNATFADLDISAGKLALISQSGALGIALAHRASEEGIGLSSFVSIGNKLDVSSNDLLCFLERDEQTSVIALYLESFGNPRKFARIAQRIGERKPIVALTAGRSDAGARGARSHTAAAATPDVVVTALLANAGVIKVDRLDELLDVSNLLLTDKLSHGGRIGLVGNSGGPLILAADACDAAGLIVSEFGEQTKASLRTVVKAAAAVTNPVDLTADGTGSELERAIDIALREEDIDAVIVVVTELPALTATDTYEVAVRLAAKTDKPIVLSLLGAHEPRRDSASNVACFPSPERAAAALAHVRQYAAWRDHRLSTMAQVAPARAATVNEVLTATLERHPNGGWLELDEGAMLLESFGLPVLQTEGVSNVAEALHKAEEIGFPVVLKARSGELVHKSEVGGVVVGIADKAALEHAYSEMHKRLGALMGGAVIQAMAPTGVEAIVGVVADPLFGPLVMVGLGGVMTDLLGDRAFGVPPFEPGQADAMVGSLRLAPLLDGYRGAPAVDRSALVHLVELVAHVADQVPKLIELDLNPVVVTTACARILDCKVRLGPSVTGPGPLFRALRARR